MLYEFQLGHNVTEAIRNICKAKGDGAVKRATAFNWYKKFKNGRFDLDDQPRSGRPLSIDPEVIREAVEENPITSQRRLSGELDLAKSTVHDHLHRLKKVNKRCREIPHELTYEQQKRRIEICQKLLCNPCDERFFKRIITSDEKWIYFSNYNRQNQWLDSNQQALAVPKMERFAKKVLLCVWWNYEGIVHFELLESGKTVNAELYSMQLERVLEALRSRYPSLVNRKRVILQQDNAKPHTSKVTLQKIEELQFDLLPHPAYSPDLAPSDYHLFRSMAHFLRGKFFASVDDVENACREFFASKDSAWYARGINQLAELWQKTINHNGLYFKE